MQGRFFRENVFLVAAVALPLVVVGFFLLATAVPRWTVPPPRHDLLFSTTSYGPTPAASMELTVVDGKLRATARPVPRDAHPPRLALWLFEHQTMNVREIPVAVPDLAAGDPPRTIDIEALAGRRVITNLRAPDGYEVRPRDDSTPGIVGELFGMRRYDRSLSIASRGRVVSIDTPPRPDSWTTPNFIGWIVDDGER